MKFLKIAVLVTVLLLLVAAPAAAQEETPGAILASEFIETHETWAINEVADNFYHDYTHPSAVYAVDEYLVTLASTYADGAPMEIVAQLFVPRAEAAETLPVYVFGAGSSGLVDKCAPSREDPAVVNIGSYKAFMLSMAAQGFVSILPDYAGFNNPDEIQPYYVATMAGRVLLDGGRAVYSFFADDAEFAQADNPVTPSDHVFIGGYSQGGQSVFAARDMAEAYAPELPVAGILGYAPVVNMQNHMLRLPQLNPYRMVAYQDFYGEDAIDLSEIFADMWLPTMYEDVTSMCVFDVAGYYSALPEEMYQPAFLEALLNDTLDEDFPTLYALLEENNPGFVESTIPSLILQGDEDATIPMPLYEQIMTNYCEAGNVMDSRVYAQTNHFRLREASLMDALEWMHGIAAGDVPEDQCAEFVES